MMHMATNDIDLDIPVFLRVTPEEAKRRKEWNAAHPPTTSAQSTRDTAERRREIDETRARLKAEHDARERVRLDSLNARKKLEKQQNAKGVFIERLPGTVWDAERNRYVAENAPMPRAKYERLMREMPTERHRQVLAEMYGPGATRCVDTASSSTAARAKVGSAATTTSRPSKTAKSSSPAATKAPSTPSPPSSTLSATGKSRGGKPEVVAGVRAMLSRPEGATLAEIGKEYGWKEHSASAFLSVNFRNKGEPTIKEEVKGRGTVYRLAPQQQ